MRIGDVVDSENINIYRQLAGGVTVAQLLHGSANPIGGQSALIKLRWGMLPEDMLIDNAPGFIKFALGENVKQSNWGDNQTTRYPQTRMGVEQVFEEYFTRAREYGERKASGQPYRRDLELEALLEILEDQRFITLSQLSAGRNQHAHEGGRAAWLQGQYLYAHTRRLQGGRYHGKARRCRLEFF